MSLNHKLSDAITIKLDKDNITSQPVIEIEFKFIRYRLLVDSKDNAEQLLKVLSESLKSRKQYNEVMRPIFYKDSKVR